MSSLLQGSFAKETCNFIEKVGSGSENCFIFHDGAAWGMEARLLTLLAWER